jgi:hypothetical protein
VFFVPIVRQPTADAHRNFEDRSSSESLKTRYSAMPAEIAVT